MTVDLQNVGVTLGGRAALAGITARLAEPRVAIVGRNGSGKTTLARVVAGLIAPDTGQARIGGIDMARDRRAALENVGIIFQNPDHQIIFPTVLEEVAFGLAQQGKRPREAEAAARTNPCSRSTISTKAPTRSRWPSPTSSSATTAVSRCSSAPPSSAPRR